MTAGSDNPSARGSGRPASNRGGRPPRLHHRARSHQSAHAEPLSADDLQLIDHPLVPSGPAELIESNVALARLIERLAAAGSFAYDSEFIGEQSYIPKLCLIQVALPQQVTLIDPLANLDLAPFWRILCDPAVEKVVHAGQQDVEPVFRSMGRPPANLFDTQIAAGMIWLPYPLSLSKLVQELVGAKLGKGLTFTSWDQRPLSAQQLRYAADDVRYLPAARQVLRERLQAAGHAEYAGEESEQLCQVRPRRFDPDQDYLKIRGAGHLNERNLAVLRELAIWRDAAARAADLPPRTLLKDEILLHLARSPVQSVARLDRVRGLPRPVESAHGQEIVEATQRGLARPLTGTNLPARPEPPPREKFQCDALWASAQAWCFGQGFDPNLVASRQEIGDLFRDAGGGGSGGGLRVMQGWRRAALGEKLLEMIRRADGK
jgi:ribonuclease D